MKYASVLCQRGDSREKDNRSSLMCLYMLSEVLSLKDSRIAKRNECDSSSLSAVCACAEGMTLQQGIALESFWKDCV